MKKALRCLIAACLLLMVAKPSFAIIFGFDNISNNNSVDAATGEAQLFVDVTDEGSGQVLFTFFNTGAEASSITDIYFDDDKPYFFDILNIFLVYNEDIGGVKFAIGAKPKNLPEGKDISFTADYSYDSDSPVQPNGINPGESLGILFDLVSDYDFLDVIQAMTDGSMGIGIHVQGFAGGGSESYTNSSNPVPEPATMLLLGTGLIGLAGISRKKIPKRG